jgi:integrase
MADRGRTVATIERKPITIRGIEAMQPGERLWDRDVRGLCITYRGRGYQYLIKARIAGRQRWLTIGEHGSPWTPESARREAERLLGVIASGLDPATARDDAKSVPSVADAFARFLTEHVEAKRKPATLEQYEYLGRLYILPALGRLRVDAITSVEVGKLHHKHIDKKTTANRIVAVVSKFCSWCERQKLRPAGSNPCVGLDKFDEVQRERFLSEDELARLGDALTAAELIDGPHVVALVRLLVLTGARRDEIRTLQWSHVDLARGLLHLPTSKTGKKTITLNAASAAILADLPRAEGNPYVIVGHRAGQPYIGTAKAWARIRKAAGLDDVRMHDLRHSFASVALARGGSLPLIGKLLGHSQPQTTARYAHLSQSPVSDLAEATGATIAAALGANQPNRPAANVLPITGKRGAA